MIDNVILLITGTLHERDVHEVQSTSLYSYRLSMVQLVSKCHPLGLFPAMASLSIAATPAELYSTVLVDTPLGMHALHPLSLTYPPAISTILPELHH